MQSLKIKTNELKDRNLFQKQTNIVDLIKRAKLEEKKEKRKVEKSIEKEEKIIPKSPKYYICTVESMPQDMFVDLSLIHI